ncbi:MAG: hypothetical protein VX834_12980 [Myxococcota bacterium]|nr:hypothetical protein [Myxococcota bacterium]
MAPNVYKQSHHPNRTMEKYGQAMKYVGESGVVPEPRGSWGFGVLARSDQSSGALEVVSRLW